MAIIAMKVLQRKPILMSPDSESKLHRAKKREECAARVDIFETLARLQGGNPASEHDVFRQRRAKPDAHTEVFGEGVVELRHKKKKIPRGGAFGILKSRKRRNPAILG